MDHILTKCKHPGQAETWALANKIWLKKTGKNLDISLPDILSCGAIKRRGKINDRGAMRLYRIIVSEAAHLIWKLRNERVIRERTISNEEIENRWRYTINLRLKIDCLSTSERYGKRKTKPQDVATTWCQTLEGEDSLSQDWISSSTGVLVGMG